MRKGSALRYRRHAITLLLVGVAVAYAGTKEEVLQRGYLICGVSGLAVGEALLPEDGGLLGFHGGICQAVAAAVLGDAGAVVYLPVDQESRLPFLWSGRLDLLVGNIGLTMQADVDERLNFAPFTFQDGSERYAPAVRHGDDIWLDTVTWVVYALIQAEEWGVTSANVASLAAAERLPAPLGRFLGFERDVTRQLGLEPDALSRVIEQVGNYGELYERHLGPQATQSIPRGPNRLYNRGGLLYAPPFSPR